MAEYVREIMSREAFTVRPHELAVDVTQYIMALGITAAPVVDAARKPLGVVSLRDLVQAATEAQVGELMSSPVRTVSASEGIEGAARRLGEEGLHHAPVVDGSGSVVGFVSSMDLLRALVNLPAQHPAAFRGVEPSSGLVWSDDRPLAADTVAQAPKGRGMVVLVEVRPGEPDRVVWSESAHDVGGRIRQIVEGTGPFPVAIREALAAGSLRYRTALFERTDEVESVLDRIRRGLATAAQR